MPATATRKPRSGLMQSQIERLRSLNATWIPSSEFKKLTEADIRNSAPADLYQPAATQQSEDHIASALLTPEGERHLFRLCNFLKYSAAKMLKKLTSENASRLVPEVERLTREWQEARTQLVQANLRLVIGLAHKFAAFPELVDEFISEGNLILINAVDKFDYTRGFRFSTYATHAVQRHFFRLMLRRQRRKQREVSSPVDFLRNVSDVVEEESPFDPKMAQALIQRFEDCLNPREQDILEQRFGLRGNTSATLKTIAEKVGLSKERVRQLQMTAIEKLQDLASQLRLHPETCL
ncbi:sigma-70 family RNA polymerase sigma factor [Planctomicrobium sp. SH661]|uniref:sigma-70 family RNA polymerase sigma factor n=1 Tax=Planctomicrobium sp. SH661 TaxID=3448124 RepID=UPI003F5B995B